MINTLMVTFANKNKKIAGPFRVTCLDFQNGTVTYAVPKKMNTEDVELHYFKRISHGIFAGKLKLPSLPLRQRINNFLKRSGVQ